jgi:sulfite exporter TauE/SafE
MCGGIMGALSYGLDDEVKQQPSRLFSFVLAYNSGRVLSYALAGGLIGGAGGALAAFMGEGSGHRWLQWLASVILILIGLHVAGWLPRLALVERIGLPLWRYLEPMGRRLMPVRSLLVAVLYGAIWGWLPCGLVYTMLITTTAQADPLSGALYMAVFGLGTLPAVAATGLLTGRLYALMRTPYLKAIIGVTIVGLGLVTLLFPALGGAAGSSI